MFAHVPEMPSLTRIQLLGHIAAAARLALAEDEVADTCSVTFNATPQGLEVECTLFVGDQPLAGWGAG